MRYPAIAVFGVTPRVLTYPFAAAFALTLALGLSASFAHGQEVVSGPCIAAGRDASPAVIAGSTSSTGSATEQQSAELLTAARLTIPVAGASPEGLRDSFNECRGERQHQGIDIAAPLRTPVIAAGDGPLVKLFDSLNGGHTVYQFDPDARFAYYYAHLDAYAPGLSEGAQLKRGDLLGYVGTTGNAAVGAPHLHFEILRLGPDKKWWEGEAINPYPFLNHANP
jgi:murein DD-endopeptidase MepM/ murein hydrolase activator NlpD